MKRLARRGAFVALCALSQGAAAHGSVQGLGNFFSGLAHPLLEPAHLICLIALGLLIGQRGLAATRPAAQSFIAGSVTGLVLAGLGWPQDTDAPLLVAAAAVGLAVVTALPVPRGVCALAASLIGLAIGLGSSPEGVSGSARVVMMIGTAVGVCVWMFNVVGLVHELERPWLKVGVRVVGSWITASAVLVMALWIGGRSVTSPMHQRPADTAASQPLNTAR